MKKCRSCGYTNPGSAEACGVCGLELPPAPSAPPAQPSTARRSPVVPALVIFVSAFSVFYSHTGKRGAPPAHAGRVSAPQAPAGAALSLERMASQRYLPDEDKLKVLRLISGPDDEVSCAAAKAAGAWLRSGAAGTAGRRLFEGLLDAADSARPAVRRRAALEAAFAAASGFAWGPYSDRMRRAAFALAAQEAPGLRGAGFILASVSGPGGMAQRIRASLAEAGKPDLALDAACALALLGEPAGRAPLAAAAARGGAVPPADWLLCLAVSSPR